MAGGGIEDEEKKVEKEEHFWVDARIEFFLSSTSFSFRVKEKYIWKKKKWKRKKEGKESFSFSRTSVRRCSIADCAAARQQLPHKSPTHGEAPFDEGFNRQTLLRLPVKVLQCELPFEFVALLEIALEVIWSQPDNLQANLQTLNSNGNSHCRPWTAFGTGNLINICLLKPSSKGAAPCVGLLWGSCCLSWSKTEKPLTRIKQQRLFTHNYCKFSFTFCIAIYNIIHLPRNYSHLKYASNII